tara:strand:- start:42526 stop:44517 length:1992 start_codon:yes stop_codon:yes gene_type:complete
MGLSSLRMPLSFIGAVFLLAINPASRAAAETAVVPPPLDAYGALPDFEDAAISPSGERIAALMTSNGQRYVMALNSELETISMLRVDDAKIRSVGWAGDDRMVVNMTSTEKLPFGFTTNRAELASTVVVAVDDKAELPKPQAVFANDQSMGNYVVGHYGTRFADGQWQLYVGGVTFRRNTIGSRLGYEFDHGRPGLFAVNASDLSATKVDGSASEGSYRDWIVDASGNLAVRLNLMVSTGKWQIMNTQGGVLASGVSPYGDVALISLGHEGRTVIYALEEDGRERWMEVPLDGSAPAAEILEDEPVERLYFDHRTGYLIGYLRAGEDPQPVFYDSDHQATASKVRAAFAGVRPHMVDWTSDMKKVLVRTNGGKDSGTWFLVDIDSMSAKAVGYERVAIPPINVGLASRFAYTARDGLAMDGILTLPPGSEGKNLPLVVLPHGGPHSHDTAGFDWWSQAFVSRGYAVFQPNFRGSTGRGLAFKRASDGEWGGKMQTDITDGVDALAEKGIVDPARACIVGGSYGGYAALAGVTIEQGRYRCAVAVAPVADIAMMVNSESYQSGRNPMLERSLEQELGPSSRYAAISPARLASRADAPVLLIHGRDDTVVEIAQSRKMADALKDAGKPHRLVVLDGEDHWLSRAETRKRMLAESVAFVIEHNPPE